MLRVPIDEGCGVMLALMGREGGGGHSWPLASHPPSSSSSLCTLRHSTRGFKKDAPKKKAPEPTPEPTPEPEAPAEPPAAAPAAAAPAAVAGDVSAAVRKAEAAVEATR